MDDQSQVGVDCGMQCISQGVNHTICMGIICNWAFQCGVSGVSLETVNWIIKFLFIGDVYVVHVL